MPKSRRRNRIANAATPTLTETPLAVELASAHSNGDAQEMEPVALPRGTDESVTTVSAAPTLRSVADVFTLEVALYVVIGIAAVLLRVVNLDARLLAPAEAQTAAAAWEFLNGKAAGEFLSPLLFTLNWLAFLLFGASDLMARLLPAVLSALLIFIPAFARNVLGKTGALVAALLIAFSPSLVFFARTLSAVDLAVGGALGALVLFWNYRESNNPRALYPAAFLAALSLTADATAFTLLIAGGIYFLITILIASRAGKQNEQEEPATLAIVLQNPLARAAILFGATYLLTATTFLLNRDGLGVAFNLLGEWFNAFSSFGNFTSPLNWLLVYEPLPLIFGLAGLVLALTLSSAEGAFVGLLRMLSVVTLATFILYSLAGNKSPAVTDAVALPLMLLAGWFIGNLLERAVDDIRASGGLRSMLSGEIPVFGMLMILTALVYLQVVTFLQQTRFSPALDQLYRLVSGDAESSFLFAAVTLGIITILLLGVFIGLSVMLVGVARTTSLMAFTILLLLALGMLRGLWLVNFSETGLARELISSAQTPTPMRDLVRDLQFNSQWQYGDPHVIRIAADSELGAVGRWYLREFPNLVWTNNLSSASDADAVITSASSPPPGDWRGQRYRINVTWTPANLAGLDLWKWYTFRQGGDEMWQTTVLWLPTESE